MEVVITIGIIVVSALVLPVLVIKKFINGGKKIITKNYK